MKITNETTTWQVAELMGDQADEVDGGIMMGILCREGFVDTDEVSDARWHSFLEEAQATRRDEGGGL